MENASKALLIAAGVLVAVIVITIGIKIFSSTSGVDKTAMTTGETISQSTKKASKLFGFSSGWKQEADGSFSNDETTGVHIGDIVNYNELSNGNKSFTPDVSKGIGTGAFELKAKTFTTEDLTWRVLGINEKGQVELISENPTSEDIYFKGEKGYLHGVEELNKLCNELYGKGKGAAKARSLTLEDIDKLAGIETEEDKKTVTPYKGYGNKIQYRFPTEKEVNGAEYLQYRTNNGSGWSEWSNCNTKSFRLPEKNLVIDKNNPGYTPELTNRFYPYEISKVIKQKTVDGKYMSTILSYGTKSSSVVNQKLANRTVDYRWPNSTVYYRIRKSYFMDIWR